MIYCQKMTPIPPAMNGAFK